MNDDMKTSRAGLEFITKWEGCILKPYKDIAGLWTVGVGHLIVPGDNFPPGVTITKDQALELLAKDVAKCETAIKKFITVPLNQNQFDALCSFAFNCGTGVIQSSSACKALNAGKPEQVPGLLLLWSKAKVNGVMTTVQGLYNRRKSEGELFMKPAAPVGVTSDETHADLSPEEKAQVEGWIAVSIQNTLNSIDSDVLHDRCSSDEVCV